MSSEAYLEQAGGSPRAEIIKPERKTKWPANMALPEKWIEDGYAIRKRHKLSRIRIGLEAEKFVNWAVGSGAKKIDWHRTFMNWCISAFCRGEPEDEPTCKTNADIILAAKAKVWAKGLRTQSINLHDVKRAVELGLLTKEEAKRLGFHITEEKE